jgi:hypothetical protein
VWILQWIKPQRQAPSHLSLIAVKLLSLCAECNMYNFKKSLGRLPIMRTLKEAIAIANIHTRIAIVQLMKEFTHNDRVYYRHFCDQRVVDVLFPLYDELHSNDTALRSTVLSYFYRLLPPSTKLAINKNMPPPPTTYVCTALINYIHLCKDRMDNFPAGLVAGLEQAYSPVYGDPLGKRLGLSCGSGREGGEAEASTLLEEQLKEEMYFMDEDKTPPHSMIHDQPTHGVRAEDIVPYDLSLGDSSEESLGHHSPLPPVRAEKEGEGPDGVGEVSLPLRGKVVAAPSTGIMQHKFNKIGWSKRPSGGSLKRPISEHESEEDVDSSTQKRMRLQQQKPPQDSLKEIPAAESAAGAEEGGDFAQAYSTDLTEEIESLRCNSQEY